MGKKEKNKKKVSGAVKTALKTEKKLNAKQKKELAALGEDDIEKVVAEIEREEARRQKVIEAVVGPPSRRVNFSLTPHPFKDELIFLGGEFHDGQRTTVYGDMFFYNINKKEWTVVKAPGAPPPRCGHQAVSLPVGKGELWVFGGEFTSPSESQFYHYRDLWVFRMDERKWEKITATGGPSARSGHRMVHSKKQLFVFGGFHDNTRDFKYYNDTYIFNLGTYTWTKLDTLGIPPAPRSGCILLPTSDNKILVYGGYSKERIRKDVDKGRVHTDMILLAPDKHDKTGTKWKWSAVKQSGTRISPRCSASGVMVQSELAYMFGGVFDEEDSEEDLRGTFYNDLYALDLEKFQWRTVSVGGKKDPSSRRRRRRAKEGEAEEEGQEEEEEENHSDSENDESKATSASKTVVDDGIFTVTLGPASAANTNSQETEAPESTFSPSPRINPGLAVKHNVLYLYGGMIEDGDRQCTLSDFYSLDCRKLDEWKTIIADDSSSRVWVEQNSSGSEDDSEDDEEDESEEDDEEEAQGMEMD